MCVVLCVRDFCVCVRVMCGRSVCGMCGVGGMCVLCVGWECSPSSSGGRARSRATARFSTSGARNDH